MARTTSKARAGIDPGALFTGSLEIEAKSREHAKDRESRLRGQEADAVLRRRKDLIFFVVSVGGVTIIAGCCAWVTFGTGGSPDDKKWATAILASIVAGCIGHLTGKGK